jgi:Ni,Fe-hydrogenase maturation factor
VLLVGCEPESVDEGAELSTEVLGAVEKAIETIKELIEEDADVSVVVGPSTSEGLSDLDAVG